MSPNAFRALAALLAAALIGGGTQDPKPLTDGIVARLDGEDISMAAYQDFLWRQTGKRAVQQMVDEILLERAATRFGVAVDDAAADAAAEARLAQAAQGRSAEEFEREMMARGFDRSLLRGMFRAEAVRLQRLDALVRATRSATDTRLQAAFENEYGPGGVRVEVRHVLCMPHVMRAERIRGGADPKTLDQEALKAEARALAEEARRKALAGEDFAALAAGISHDQVSKKEGGRIASYRPGLYGADFGAAVEALQPGQTSAVIESGAGFHVLRLDSRTVTRLEDVREEMVARVLAAEPDWQEREELLAALRGKADLQLW